jgi:cell fate regulator YaaT (PSP1 superfamily)
MHLIEVAFKGNRKEFYSWEGDEPPPLRASVVVEADRGEDLGTVHAVGEMAQKRCTGCTHGCGTSTPSRKAVRLAASRDVRQAKELRAQDETARRKATERVKAHGLVMKLSDAEWQWDRKKLTFYFTADKRVDFRNLVRDLAALFRARIELKQIGVRDEAKRLDGIGRCGRQYCSASWLPELRPVNLGVAKDQQLSLNPSQISGACGRLMCCLRYEHEFYVQSRKRFPKEGKTVTTARGEEKVMSNDIFNERVTLRGADGETRVIQLSALRRELAATGSPLPGGSGAGGGVAAGDGEAAVSAGDSEEAMGDEVSDEARELAVEGAAEGDVTGADWSDIEEADEGLEPPPAGAAIAAAADPEIGPSPDEDQVGQPGDGAVPEEPSGVPPATSSAASSAASSAGSSASSGGRRRRGRRGGRRGRGRGGHGPSDGSSPGSGESGGGSSPPRGPGAPGTPTS